jgi:hypothetical protein
MILPSMEVSELLQMIEQRLGLKMLKGNRYFFEQDSQWTTRQTISIEHTYPASYEKWPDPNDG